MKYFAIFTTLVAATASLTEDAAAAAIEEEHGNLRSLQTCSNLKKWKCNNTSGCKWRNKKKKCVSTGGGGSTTGGGGSTTGGDSTTTCPSIRKKWKCNKNDNCQWKNRKCQEKLFVAAPTPTTPSTTAPPPPSTNTGDRQAALNRALESCPSNDSTCQSFLTAHNERRYDYHIANGQTTPSLLKWNDNMAAQAQSWAQTMANQCQFGHSGASGENLYAQSNAPGTNFGEQVLQMWWDREQQRAEAGRTKNIGHFTAAAWYVTYEIGCAVSQGTCTKVQNGRTVTSTRTYAVCQYNHAGNCNVGNYADWKRDIMENPDDCGQRLPV